MKTRFSKTTLPSMVKASGETFLREQVSTYVLDLLLFFLLSFFDRRKSVRLVIVISQVTGCLSNGIGEPGANH